jgi:hypothetical protein
MVDNVAITAGTGTSVATDDVGGVHYQKIKLAIGAADTANLLAVGSGAIDTGTPRVALATDSPGVLTLGAQASAASVSMTAATNTKAFGYIAQAHGVNPTAVNAGAQGELAMNRAGIPFYIGGHPNPICRSYRILDADGAQTNLNLLSGGAIGAGTKVCLTQIWVKADKDNTGNVSVQIGFGASAPPTPSASGVNQLVIDEDLGAGEGHQIGNGAGLLAVGADGHELWMTCGDPAGGGLTIGFTYYTIES